MTRLERPHLIQGVMGVLGESRFDTDSDNTSSGGDGGNQSGNAVVPAGPFFVYPVSEEWAVGFSLTAPFVGSLDPSDGWAGRYLLRKLELSTYRFGPAAAYQVNDWLSLGATVGINYSSLDLRVAIPSLVPGAPDGGLRIKDADEWEPTWGLSALVEPCEGTRLGLVYNSELENDDLGGDLTINGAVVGFSSDVDVGFTLPQFAALSLRQEVTDDLLLFLDVGWADFSEFESLQLDIDALGAVELDTHFHDAIAYGIAAEYRLSSEWTVTGGISYASSPVSGGNRSAALPVDRQVRYGAGVRHRWREDVTLALSYEYLDLGDNELTNSVPGGTLSGDYSPNHVQFIALTVGKSF
jgi:long-chain fatty acid transport protein